MSGCDTQAQRGRGSARELTCKPTGTRKCTNARGFVGMNTLSTDCQSLTHLHGGHGGTAHHAPQCHSHRVTMSQLVRFAVGCAQSFVVECGSAVAGGKKGGRKAGKKRVVGTSNIQRPAVHPAHAAECSQCTVSQ